MIIVTDHHHIGDLERKVVEPYCNEQEIRCIGDLSVHQMLANDTSLCKAIQGEYRRINKLPEDAELSLEEKSKISRKAIKSSNAEMFTKWKVFYGATPIYNLVRKVYINEKLKKSEKKERGFIGLMSHEKLLTVIQECIAKRMNSKTNENYIRNILRAIETTHEDIAHEIYGLLSEAGIDEPKKYIIDTLDLNNFGGDLPTSENVFADHPKLKYFHFRKDIFWEFLDKTMIVYVPLFEIPEERVLALRSIGDMASDYNKGRPESVIIGYHGNPFAEGMGIKRSDYQLSIIEPLAKQVYDLTKKSVKIFCGHLHKSHKPYGWNFSGKSAMIYPINVDEFYEVSTADPSEEPSKKIRIQYKKYREISKPIKEDKK